jgi:hypothetical protein
MSLAVGDLSRGCAEDLWQVFAIDDLGMIEQDFGVPILRTNWSRAFWFIVQSHADELSDR